MNFQLRKYRNWKIDEIDNQQRIEKQPKLGLADEVVSSAYGYEQQLDNDL
jgi:hypothetical protein